MNPCGGQFASMLNMLRKNCAGTSVLRSGISFHKTSTFSKHEPYYSKVSSEQLCIPSRDTRDIIAAAGRALDKIWKDGHNYAKAGVMLNDFRPCGVTQLSLFDEGRSYANSDALMNVLGLC
jgi:DNA polymerase V